MGSGQGYETTIAQCVAAGLGVGPDVVNVLLGHTDIAPYGMGSRGSRGAAAGGGVAYLAGCRAAAKVLADKELQAKLQAPGFDLLPIGSPEVAAVGCASSRRTCSSLFGTTCADCRKCRLSAEKYPAATITASTSMAINQ